MIETGALSHNGVRVLFLPHAISLSDAELAAIRAFAAAGGTVLADTEPGLFDGHLRRREALPLPTIAKVSESVMRRGGTPDASQLEGLAEVLRASGAPPRAVFRTPDGGRATGIEARCLRHGATQLLSVQSSAPYAAAARIAVELSDTATIRDMRADGTSVTAAHFTIALDPADPSILEISPR